STNAGYFKMAPRNGSFIVPRFEAFCSQQEQPMFSSGNVTVYVSDMDAAVRFYSETLGLRLAYRFGNHWASIELGKGLTIGLHPASQQMPAGKPGSMAIGLELTGSIHEAMKTLAAKGVRFHGPANEAKAGSFVSFNDPDGNLLYLAQLNW